MRAPTLLALLAGAAMVIGCRGVPKGYGDPCLWDDDCRRGLHCSSYFGGRCTVTCGEGFDGDGEDDCPGTSCQSDTAARCNAFVFECSPLCLRELGECDESGKCLDE